jgi:uncharacterized phiE125 gp8 family phage protein
MDFSLIASPNEEPVSLAEAKLFLRVDDAADDNVILMAIKASRMAAESYTRRAICTQVWEVRFDEFPSSGEFIELPKAPLSSVQQVSYINSLGTLVQAELADFDTIVLSGPYAMPGSIGPKSNKAWPEDVADTPNCARIRFVCGYGAAADVPGQLKQAILMMVADIYQNREAKIVGTIATENQMVNSLLFPFKVF